MKFLKTWKLLFLFAWLPMLLVGEAEKPIPYIHVGDTINPGSADFITSAIVNAEKNKAPFVVVEIDTPGGLLSSTRQIVQTMLNSKIPVVVFVGPKGAHAGSAGALITLAADVAAMAPGTNIGAAHPVSGGGEPMDKIMSEKVANDVAAFAESVSRAKGRNTEWAVKAVKNSASIAADEALKLGVIDLIAEDVPDLLKKLSGFKLKVAKNGVATLSAEPTRAEASPMTIKQRFVSFLADPNLAYIIMTIGGICLWVELSHPGLILPGVVGALCLILSLVSFQTLPIDYGALALILLGMCLVIAELYLPTYGVLGVGGLVAFVCGSLFLMDTGVPEFQISLKLILPTAATVAILGLVLGWVVMRTRNAKARSGVEALIGEFGEVREPVSEKRGKVFVQGELWNAISSDGIEITSGSVIQVTQVKNMLLVVAAKAS